MKYKNISSVDCVLPNIGSVSSGQIIESDTEINNPNFELVEEKSKEKSD